MGERDERKERRERERDTGLGFERRSRSAMKRFCEFELKFLRATVPHTLVPLIAPHRIRVAPFFPPPRRGAAAACEATRRGGKKQFVTDIPRRDNVFSRPGAARQNAKSSPVIRRQKRDVTRRYAVSATFRREPVYSVWNLFYLPQLPLRGSRRDAFSLYARIYVCIYTYI